MGKWRMAATLGALMTLLGGNARAADPSERPDAQMLLDLDLLRDPDLAKSRELYRRMGVVERMRMLEMLPALDSDSQATPSQPASGPQGPPRATNSGGK